MHKKTSAQTGRVLRRCARARRPKPVASLTYGAVCSYYIYIYIYIYI